MFRVDWLQSALDELTALWVQADSATRAALTAAGHTIDQRLGKNPADEGESRSAGQRITFVPPLAISFRSNLTAKPLPFSRSARTASARNDA